MGKARPIAGLLALTVLALGACSATEPPLLSPLDQAKVYGYSELSVGDHRYVVSYLGPARLTLSYPTDRDREAKVARDQAYDFALWRAALIAKGAGFDGLRVTNRQSEVNTVAQPTYYDPNAYMGFGTSIDRFGTRRGIGFGSGYDSGAYYPPSPYARIQARVSIDVELVHGPGPNDLKVEDVLARLHHAYPGAEQPTPAG